MKTEVRKRLATCLMLWGAFVLIKWIMLLSPSSILSKLGPLTVILKDGSNDYRLSGYISLGIETALTGAFVLIRMKKITPLYLVCAIYSLLYAPALVYWIATLEFEAWRYMQFAPAVLCAVFMLIGCKDYMTQQVLKRRKPVKISDDKQVEKKDTDPDKEENENGSSDE